MSLNMSEFTLRLTNTCNLNCSYCYQGEKKNKRMTKEIGEKSINYFIDNSYDKEKVWLTFMGGEPFLEYDLMKHLTEYFKQKANEKNIQYGFHVSTNGLLINENNLDFLIENDFEIHLSLDGDKETHDLHRINYNGEGSFEKVLETAKLLNNSNANLYIRMTVTPKTIKKLSHNIKWFIKQGFPKINIGCDFFTDWNGYYDELENQLDKVKDIYLKNKLYLDIYDGNRVKYILKSKPNFCGAGFNKFEISTDGKRYPCGYVIDDPKFCYQDVYDNIDKEYRKLSLEQSVDLNEKKCNTCDINYFCIGRKCGFLNYKLTGYLNKCNEILCFHEKVIFSQMKDIVKNWIDMNDENTRRIIDYGIEKEMLNDLVLELVQ